MSREVVQPRVRRALLLAGLVLGPALVVTGCGGGSSGGVSLPTLTRTATPPSITLPGTSEASETPEQTATGPALPTRTSESPAETTTSESSPPETTSTSEPSRTSTTTVTRTSEVTTTVTHTSEVTTSAETPTPTPTSTVSGTPTSSTSSGVSPWLWILLILLIAAALGAWLLMRSRRRSGWDTQAGALQTDTRAALGAQLPPVLTAQTAGQRALSWPPVRAVLIDLIRRWDQLAGEASDDVRRDDAGHVRGLLQELVAAVDAENEALATGRDWTLLRPRVEGIERALSAALSGQPAGGPPPGGVPGPPSPYA